MSLRDKSSVICGCSPLGVRGNPEPIHFHPATIVISHWAGAENAHFSTNPFAFAGFEWFACFGKFLAIPAVEKLANCIRINIYTEVNVCIFGRYRLISCFRISFVGTNAFIL